MDLATARLLAAYNKATNIEMNSLIAKMSTEQWTREFPCHFNSVKSLSNHVFIGDYNWLKRFSKLRKFHFVENAFFETDIAFSDSAFQDVDGYFTKRKQIDEYIIQFAEELTDSDLGKDLEYRDSHGTLHRKNFGKLILHCFNHQTHHRGMISVYMEMMRMDNDYSNLAYLV